MTWQPLFLLLYGFLVVYGCSLLHARALRRLRAADRLRAFDSWKRRNCIAPVSFGADVAPANDVTRSERRRAA